MAYNGFWADFLFNTGVVAAWCVFLWRVLDGPRFSWWGTALLTLVIDAAYLLPVLLLEPEILLLDEPTSSLDIHNQYQVLQITRDLCREQNLTAMIVIHDLNLALRFCDRFLLLREGEVYRYGGAEIFDADALRDVYGVRGSIVQVQGQSLVLIEDEEKEKLS